jgi:hypothetical protein
MFFKRRPPDPSPAVPSLRRLPKPDRGRTIAAYRGELLPGYLHTFRIEHLRPIPGEPYAPYKQESHFTHTLWILYRADRAAHPTILINAQHNLALATYEDFQTPDWVAFQVLKFVAEFVAPGVVSELKDPKLLRRIPSSADEESFAPLRESFWNQAVERKCRAIDKKRITD